MLQECFNPSTFYIFLTGATSPFAELVFVWCGRWRRMVLTNKTSVYFLSTLDLQHIPYKDAFKQCVSSKSSPMALSCSSSKYWLLSLESLTVNIYIWIGLIWMVQYIAHISRFVYSHTCHCCNVPLIICSFNGTRNQHGPFPWYVYIPCSNMIKETLKLRLVKSVEFISLFWASQLSVVR